VPRFDGSPPEEVMRLPLGQFSDRAVEDPFVSVRAFGTRVAIGVHGRDLIGSGAAIGDHAAPHARVITLDVNRRSTNGSRLGGRLQHESHPDLSSPDFLDGFVHASERHHFDNGFNAMLR
jgi:hypothetical protein